MAHSGCASQQSERVSMGLWWAQNTTQASGSPYPTPHSASSRGLDRSRRHWPASPTASTTEAVSRVCQPFKPSEEIAGVTHRDRHPLRHWLANRTVCLLRTSNCSLPGRLPESLLKVLFEKSADGVDRLLGIGACRLNHQPRALGRGQREQIEDTPTICSL